MTPRRSLLDLALPLAVAVAVLPLGFATLYGRTWAGTRAGLAPEAQRASLRTVPWFKPEFARLVAALEEALPADARILLEPTGLAPDSPSPTGRTRWYLYLAYALYPREVHVRQPKLASGTLVDYPGWWQHHTEVLDLDGSGQHLGAVVLRERVAAEEAAALLERDVRWRLTYPISRSLRLAELELFERVDPGDDPAAIEWVRRDLAGLLASTGATPALEPELDELNEEEPL